MFGKQHSGHKKKRRVGEQKSRWKRKLFFDDILRLRNEARGKEEMVL
jgi:hypothetical protein